MTCGRAYRSGCRAEAQNEEEGLSALCMLQEEFNSHVAAISKQQGKDVEVYDKLLLILKHK
jgi:hypothetical protein